MICVDHRGRLIPIQKSKLTRRRAEDSTPSTARRANEVRLFFLDWYEKFQTASVWRMLLILNVGLFKHVCF